MHDVYSGGPDGGGWGGMRGWWKGPSGMVTIATN